MTSHAREGEPPGGWDRPVPATPMPEGSYAGWWSRVAAALIDLMILTVPALGLTAVLFGGVGSIFSGDDNTSAVVTLVLGLLVLFFVFSVAVLLYGPLLMRRGGQRNGQTLGKQALGIRVVRVSGVPMDFGWSALREVLVKGLALGFVSTVVPVLPYVLDALWPLWDEENRAIHDMAVDTRVVEA